MLPLALVVDDEPDICELLSLTLQRMGVDCHSAANLSEAKRLLINNRYDFCLTDLRLPDGDGLQLVEYIQSGVHRDVPVAVITAHGNMDTAIKALKLGAFDFVSKPVDLEHLRTLVQLALRLDQNRHRPKVKDADQLLLGEAENMRKLREQIAKVTRSDAPVYISGESGCGKELAARAIHAQGARADKPFVPINCGAIPAELMESEFFGHKKGSFTGAHKNNPGLMQSAQGGTLFLDEVADLPLDMQVKLLRAIQEKCVRPIGASREVSIDVRILSATHKDLGRAVSEGRFRSDLYYRINVIEISIPPLRERTEDIPLLAEVIMQRIASHAGLASPKLSPSALSTLQQYPFPGNVRQLENILERALTLCDKQEIRSDDLLLAQDGQPFEHDVPPAQANRREAQNPGHFDPSQYASLDEFLHSIEKEAIENALLKTRWNRTAAAQKLGISFRSLRYRLKKLGLES
ncbi:sigma-54 dependent transcriptional regulator [Microbulbifer sp. 2205BS26-8]|uniref:sigma-54-dependent transcriptional regulator n=1 Tax=Microbulbifer sp. 2205BS26-8 TaxID=3064386 RepID=UPI00273DC356|nr:sigma-54 dependent transcriptional regulator [Microbulbifer sp. 2205BS26-8]MDP5210261.1 sigma-54 dependent transcriptional regulator [Microbulbifer sp. 2205BS26-8]